MTPSSKGRLAALTSGVLMATSACGGTQPTEQGTNAHFALTNARAVVDPGDSYPVNLIFLAEATDPIWDSVTGVGLPGGQQVSESQLSVERSDAHLDGLRLGNIRFELPPEDDAAEFAEVELFLDGVAAPQVVAVGDWAVMWSQLPSDVSPTGDFALSVPRCGAIEGAFRNESSSSLEVVEVAVETPGVSVTPATLPSGVVPPGATVEVDAEVDCDMELADFYVLSPAVTLARPDGSSVAAHLDPIAVGLTSIEEDTLRRIATRDS
ncbi:hypothetical protein GXB85_12145 [Cellulomonas sp. APG4]|uniref:hypothetical protein n=1 Tax=Cellulomonas sp. APG4 TaxID=1538656 RepID=UPI00137AD60B|nr:hypothetical protein [Cellulomonas sp. APG4]NCT91696.1 hypothetical protein [Cellulomonas sp. APG4]